MKGLLLLVSLICLACVAMEAIPKGQAFAVEGWPWFRHPPVHPPPVEEACVAAAHEAVASCIEKSGNKFPGISLSPTDGCCEAIRGLEKHCSAKEVAGFERVCLFRYVLRARKDCEHGVSAPASSPQPA